jgi:hypothetical protein
MGSLALTVPITGGYRETNRLVGQFEATTPGTRPSPWETPGNHLR